MVFHQSAHQAGELVQPPLSLIEFGLEGEDPTDPGEIDTLLLRQ